MAKKTIRIEFTEDYRCYKKGTVINLPTPCCIVGDNGSGKSTLLSIIRYHAVEECGHDNHYFLGNSREKVANVTGFDFPNSFSYSTSTDNPATVGQFNEELFDKGVEIGSIEKSSGQAQVWNLVHVLNQAHAVPGSLLILDEPEISIDFRHRIAVSARLRRMMEQYRQPLIVCSHSPDIMRLFDTVFVIPTGEIMETEAYIMMKEMEPVAAFLKEAPREVNDTEYKQLEISEEEEKMIERYRAVDNNDIYTMEELSAEEQITPQQAMQDLNRLALVIEIAKSKPENSKMEIQQQLASASDIIAGVINEAEKGITGQISVREALSTIRAVLGKRLENVEPEDKTQ